VGRRRPLKCAATAVLQMPSTEFPSTLAVFFHAEYNAFILTAGVERVACPFFMPTNKLENGGWLHPSRLPLGAGWSGHCCAPGHEGAQPQEEELREFCNMGYAAGCARLPRQRAYDALRFSITRDRGTQLELCFVCESDHRPASHGVLEYDLLLGQWTSSHSDARIRKMANCYLQAYLLRRIQPAAAGLNRAQPHEPE
jgi:hypothetical protein